MTGKAYTNATFTVLGSRDSPYSDFMGQGDKASPYSVFMEQSDRTSPYAVSTGQTVRDSPWSQWLVWCGLERSSRDKARQASCLATPRLPEEYYKDWTRHRPFDHTSPCSGRPIWTSQICAIGWQHLSRTGHFCKLKTNLVSFLGWRTQAANLNRGSLTVGAALTVLRRQSLGSFISDGWPKWAEPPERESEGKWC